MYVQHITQTSSRAIPAVPANKFPQPEFNKIKMGPIGGLVGFWRIILQFYIQAIFS
jgi:hypothetical protein